MYQKALVYERAKDYKKAKSILLDFLSKATATSLKPKSMIDLAQTYSAEGNYSAAIETYSNLVSQYSETEYAPEALLHSAKINLDMGQIDKADENLRQLLKQYPESKSVIFAKIELGNLENKKSNFPSAIDLFKGALNSTTDKELIEELKVKIGKSFQASGQLTEAANIFSDVMATTDNPELADSMHAALLFIKLRENQISDARRLFESFPELVQGQLLLSTPAIQAPASKPQSTLLVNGFSVGRLPSPNSQPIITIVENPAITQKYKVVGPIYKLAFENLPDSANPTVPVLFPVKRKWLETKRVIPGKSAIYCFANNHFSNVTSTYDSLTATYQINTSKSGLYLLFEEPLQTFTLYNIYFDVDKATIRKESEVNLFETIDRMKSYPDILLEIAGHTDSTGTDEHNVQLSLDRAESIKKFMVENGISPDRLKTRGYGSSLPVAPNTTEENLQKNRRTEFTILTELTALSTTDSVSTRKYIIYVNSFYNMKEAYDLRNFLKKRNYPATVMTNMQGVVTYYDIILGIFSTENEAESLLSQFSSEFKQFNPVIRTL
jgi:outer membrane protein OmpA-like peptidoglycan-associated protein/predicted negative regulator of RcsB-dependent stress response